MSKRQCIHCQHKIAERYPVFLVRYPSGKIVGPMHSWCGAAVARQDYLENNGLNMYILDAGTVGMDCSNGE